jgi:hypothetical protein
LVKRVIATLPESIAELCLVRLGIQVRGLRALFYAIRLARAIDRSAAEAIASGAGLLHSERYSIGRNHFGVLQYWRRFEDLEAWSHRPPHSEWWRKALERMRTRGDLGIYHETFLVPRDRIETIYLDCAPAGLAVFGTPGEPVGTMTTSRGRLGRG